MGRASRNVQLKEALEMLRYMAEHRFGATIHEFIEELGINRRKVYRLLVTFRELKIPIITTYRPDSSTKVFRLANRPQVAALLGIM